METTESGLIQLELKYCERCGALWLRLRGSDLVFCRECVKAVVELPNLDEERTDAMPESAVNCAQGAFWAEGGNA